MFDARSFLAIRWRLRRTAVTRIADVLSATDLAAAHTAAGTADMCGTSLDSPRRIAGAARGFSREAGYG